MFCVLLKLRESAIHLWGRSGRVMAAKNSQISAKFPQNFRSLFWRNNTHFLQISATFPQNFRKLHKKPFANDPISELLRERINVAMPADSRCEVWSCVWTIVGAELWKFKCRWKTFRQLNRAENVSGTFRGVFRTVRFTFRFAFFLGPVWWAPTYRRYLHRNYGECGGALVNVREVLANMLVSL